MYEYTRAPRDDTCAVPESKVVTGSLLNLVLFAPRFSTTASGSQLHGLIAIVHWSLIAILESIG
jgi:hypothetical protein